MEDANAENVAAINEKYDRMLSKGKNKINNVCVQWKQAKDVVTEFENKPIDTIIA